MDNTLVALLVIVVCWAILSQNKECTDQGLRLARIGMSYECVK